MTLIHSHQSSLFDQAATDELPRPDIIYRDGWCENHQWLFDTMRRSMPWNKQFKSRHTVSFGVSYTDRSGLSYKRPFPEWLLPLAENIQSDFGYYPNNCLANFYPTGNHYISFHSDQDMEMKTHSGVAIVSFGSTRQMELRKIDNHQLRYAYPLLPGSVFYMEDVLQKDWQHGILTQAESGPRISLSFRALKSPSPGVA